MDFDAEAGVSQSTLVCDRNDETACIYMRKVNDQVLSDAQMPFNGDITVFTNALKYPVVYSQI